MARSYVALAPPSSPIMLDYGAGFPDFIGAFEPAKCLPYLQDVARIERAWIEAYHAVEAEPLASAVFTLSPQTTCRISVLPCIRRFAWSGRDSRR
jgi:hypothetical protein